MTLRATLVFCIAGVVALRGAATGVSLERQFRADIEAVIRATWSPNELHEGAISKKVDEMVADARRSFSTLFADCSDDALPTEEGLTTAFVRLLALDRQPPRWDSAPLLSFYIERWMR